MSKTFDYPTGALLPSERGTVMTSIVDEPKRLARMAGVLYLLVLGAVINEGYVLPMG